MGNECPRCGRVDQVQKLSAIVQGGTTHEVYGGQTMEHTWAGSGKVTGDFVGERTSRTALAQRLAPPGKPDLEDTSLGGVVLAFLVAFGLVCLFVVLGLRDMAHQWWMALAGIFLGILGAYFCWKSPSELARMHERNNVKTDAWQRQMAVWNASYYCYRDDYVYSVWNGAQHTEPRSVEDGRDLLRTLTSEAPIRETRKNLRPSTERPTPSGKSDFNDRVYAAIESRRAQRFRSCRKCGGSVADTESICPDCRTELP